MKTNGIYCIENTINNKKYIGSSIDCDHRWYIHIWHLKRKDHPNIHLQSAWDKYGESNFKFYLIEQNILEEQLLSKEQYYMSVYNTLDREYGYNIAADTTAPMKGRKHSEESIMLMSERKKGEKNNFFGKHHSEETKEKLRKGKIGKKLSPEHRLKVIKNIHKIGAENKNNKSIEIIKKYSEITGVHCSTIRRVLNNKTWKEN
jgi:group I intron endonuclease